METSRECFGCFGRTTLQLGLLWILSVLLVASPAVGQVEPMVPAPWRVPVAQSTGSWLDDGACTSGTCALGDGWDDGCQGCMGYSPFAGRPWFRGEYLIWWTKSGDSPPLATTSSPLTPYEEAGVLPDADVLAGG